MLKKWIIVLLVLVLALGAVGCGRRRPMRQPSEGQTQEEETQEDQTQEGETEEGAGTPAVNDKIELYSYSYRWPGGHYHGWESGSEQEESGLEISAESTAAYLEEGDTFYIDITLIDLEDTVDFIYTVEINGVKYRYSDGVFGNTERDREEKTVTFSVELTYDGETNVYRIDSIIVMSDLSIRYYVTIPEENKPVELPSRAGSGTEEDPYLVYNAEMFLEMSEYPAGTYFRQMNDIDISAVDTGEKVQSGTETVLDRWKPMGTSAEPFRSHYDGNNFKITRLSIQRMDTKYSEESFGLFGTAVGSEIKNVILEDYRVEVRYSVTVGALVGFAQDCTIENCKLVQGRKENFESGSWSFSNMGGLIGFAYGCEVSDCSVTSDLGLYSEDRGVYPLYGMLGGVVGELRDSVLKNCTFSGSMESGSVAGGIIGRSDRSVIVGCRSGAQVTASRIAGGLIGQMWRSGLAYSSFSGKISFPLNAQMNVYGAAFFGGLVGDAGMYYSGYSTIGGPQIASEIFSCEFSGTIGMESMLGIMETATAGGVCARSYDCNIHDVNVFGAVIDGAQAAVFAGSSENDAGSVACSVAERVFLTAPTTGVSFGRVSDSYLLGAPNLAWDGVTFVDAPADSQDCPALDEAVWSFLQGEPRLCYTDDVPQDTASLLIGDWRARYAES